MSIGSEILKVGVGRADITPEVGAILHGYAPGRPAKSINDRLHFTCFAFGYGELRCLAASADLCLLVEPIMGVIRKRMSEVTGVPVDNIIVCTTHTHSAPVTTDNHGYPMDREYVFGTLPAKAEEAAVAALTGIQPAEMGIGTTLSDVGVNRREITRNGSVILGQNPCGSRDPVMTVISFRTHNGRPIGNIIHYGAHNTASGMNPEITRDWCGVMKDRLEEEIGGLTAFFNGCEGDCGPRLTNGKTTGNLKLALELGGVAAADAVRACRSIREWRRDCELKVLARDIELRYKPMPPLDDMKARLAGFKNPESLKGLNRTDYESLVERIRIAESGEPVPSGMHLRQTAVSIGSLALLPIPFETFSGVTLRMSAHSRFAHTLSISLANGANGYFPSRDQICRGGYEIWMFSSVRLFPFRDDSEQTYIEYCLGILDELFDAGQK